MRFVFMMLCFAVNLMTLICAFAMCVSTPASNQYLMAVSIIGGIVLATFGTNMLRVLVNCYGPKCLGISKAQKARETLKDISCVQ